VTGKVVERSKEGAKGREKEREGLVFREIKETSMWAYCTRFRCR